MLEERVSRDELVPHVAEGCMLDALTDELLAQVARHLAASCLLSACACQRRLAELLARPPSVALRAAERLEGHRVDPQRIASLPLLAALEAVAATGLLRGNRVYFRQCGEALCDDDDSIPLVLRTASLLRRHPQLVVRVEGHTSPRAPALLAPLVTIGRARAVADLLEEHGVREAQLEAVTGWGWEVCVAAGWPAGRETAVAELFVGLRAGPDEELLYLPERPAWYGSAEPPRIEDRDTQIYTWLSRLVAP